MGIAPETTMVIVMARRLHTIKETITTSNNNNDNSNRQQTTDNNADGTVKGMK